VVVWRAPASWSAVAALLAALVLGASACGGDDEDEPPQPAPAEAVPGAPEPRPEVAEQVLAHLDERGATESDQALRSFGPGGPSCDVAATLTSREEVQTETARGLPPEHIVVPSGDGEAGVTATVPAAEAGENRQRCLEALERALADLEVQPAPDDGGG
jgi:hypothetical protein